MQREVTRFRSPIPIAKKLAIALQWLATGGTEVQLANEYCVGATTVHRAVHEVVRVICETIVHDAVKFPTGEKLIQVMEKFEQMALLKMCAGALDGTFMKIRKPEEWGNAFWCYKNHCAIMLLAVVDADGLFTFVDAGRAGSMGDAFTFNHSSLKEKIDAGEWLEGQAQEVQGRLVRPYLVADSAFALTQSLIKGYDYPPAPGHQKSFNAAVVKHGELLKLPLVKLKAGSAS